MVRYAACQIPGLESAPVASTFQVNWKERQFAGSSAAEFADELKSFSLLAFEDGQWKTGSMREFKQVDFGAPFGVKYCMPMFIEEFRPLPELIPSLKETGFFSSGFGGIVDYVFIPFSFGLLTLFPKQSRNWIARLMEWGLKHTTCPPYGAVLRMEAQGQGRALVMTVSHGDPYFLTAAPAVACLLQYFDGTIRNPGLWRQGTLVEPVRFFADLTNLGVSVSVTSLSSWSMPQMLRSSSGSEVMQHKLLRPLLILAAVPGLALLLIVAAELSVRFEPVTAVAAAPDGEYIRLQADARLFTLFAALNAEGYDEENNEQGISDVRRQVRAAPAEPGRGDPASTGGPAPLPGAVPHHPRQPVRHVDLAARPGAGFRPRADGWAVTAPAFLFFGFDRALAAFYQEADIAELWGRRSGPRTRPRSPAIATWSHLR